MVTDSYLQIGLLSAYDKRPKIITIINRYAELNMALCKMAKLEE